MAVVQFIGIQQVLKMFEAREIEAWSIWQSKQFIHKGIGETELETFLKMIEPTASGATYTLKVYEGIANAADIKDKTPSDGNFNFKFANEAYEDPRYEGVSRRNKLVERVEFLEEQLGRKESPEDFEPETIGDVLKSPEKTKEYLEVIQMLGNIVKGFFGQQPAPYIGNVTKLVADKPEPTVQAEYNDRDQQRLIAAINTLQANDPKILQHLEKLADIAVKDKTTFSMLLTMLDNK